VLATRDRVPVAAVFDFFSSVIPGGWVRVAQWSVRGTTPPDVSVPVDFYAPTAADAARLRRAMQAFLPHVPSDVEVRWGGSAS
jgi:hypothetical protein